MYGSFIFNFKLDVNFEKARVFATWTFHIVLWAKPRTVLEPPSLTAALSKWKTSGRTLRLMNIIEHPSVWRTRLRAMGCQESVHGLAKRKTVWDEQTIVIMMFDKCTTVYNYTSCPGVHLQMICAPVDGCMDGWTHPCTYAWRKPYIYIYSIIYHFIFYIIQYFPTPS